MNWWDVGVWIGYWISWLHSRFLITIQSSAIGMDRGSQQQAQSFATLLSCGTGFWLPMADAPFPEFLKCPHATATATLD
jgi:hypothetical protein